MAQDASDYRLDPLTEEDKKWIESNGIDLDCEKCNTYLQAFDNLGQIFEPSGENCCPLQAQLVEHTLTKQFRNNLPQPKDKEQKKNLIQYVLCKAGLDFLKGKVDGGSLLPKLDELIAKYTVDPYYRVEPLSEDEKRYIGPLGIDLNNKECITYLDRTLEKKKKTLGKTPAQTEQLVLEQRNRPDSSQNSLLKRLKVKFPIGNEKMCLNFPEPRDEAEKRNLIHQIIYKAGIEDVDEGEYDILLILPGSRQLIGKFQLLHLVLGYILNWLFLISQNTKSCEFTQILFENKIMLAHISMCKLPFLLVYFHFQMWGNS